MKPIVLLSAWLALTPALFAATATFFPVADTTISPNDEALATGSTDTMIAGHLPMPDVPARALLRFDLTSLPPGAVVTSATVEVTASVVANALFAHTHLLHRISQDWTEAGAGWAETGVGGGGWENSGGDFDPASDASVPVSGTGTYSFSSTPALVATVQAWAANAGTNFGWVLRSAVEDEEGTRTGRRFFTREATANRPKLVVGYTVPPPPVTLTNARVEGANFRFEFTALPGSTYTVQSRPRVDSGAWTTVSVHPAPGSPTVIPVTHALTPTNRFYRVVSP
jgi:hypothetical protein